MMYEEALLCLLTILCLLDLNECISCYVCQSVSNHNPDCEDPFFTNRTETFLRMPCMTGRKSRNGQFPATACVKLAGAYVDSGEEVVIRTCALDSGSLTTDTELVRASHCGSMILDELYVRGCLTSCFTDGCNSAPPRVTAAASLLITAAAAVIAVNSITRAGRIR